MEYQQLLEKIVSACMESAPKWEPLALMVDTFAAQVLGAELRVSPLSAEWNGASWAGLRYEATTSKLYELAENQWAGAQMTRLAQNQWAGAEL